MLARRLTPAAGRSIESHDEDEVLGRKVKKRKQPTKEPLKR
jgi:hypothetical protein